MLRNRINRVKHLTRILRSSCLVRLELLPSPRIRIGRINLFELKFNLSITLYAIANLLAIYLILLK